MTCIKRREFITLLGGAAAWPLAARAQQPRSDASHRRAPALQPQTIRKDRPASWRSRKHLQQLGWTVGGNLRIDARWGAGDAERIRKYAAELVALTPDVIVAMAARQWRRCSRRRARCRSCSRTLTDPVGAGSSRAWRGRAAMPPVLLARRIRHEREMA